MARRQQADDGGGCLVFVAIGLLLVVVFLAIAWPFYFGGWVATRAGAADSSDARTIVPILLEACYVVALVSVGAGLWLVRRDNRRDERAAGARRARREEGDSRVAALERAAQTHRDEVAALETSGRLLKRSSSGTAVAALPKWGDVLDPAELCWGTGPAAFSAPRVANRGGPKVQTDVELGRYVVTDRQVRFRGATRDEAWPLARITSVEREVSGGRTRFLFALVGRKTVSGLSTDGVFVEILQAQLSVARGESDPGAATARLGSVTSRVLSDLGQVESELGRARAALVDERDTTRN